MDRVQETPSRPGLEIGFKGFDGFIFRCHLAASAEIRLSDEHTAYAWFDLDQLSKVQRIRVEDCLNYGFYEKTKTHIYKTSHPIWLNRKGILSGKLTSLIQIGLDIKNEKLLNLNS